MSSTPLQIEVPFTLPKGYADEDGSLHREGVMRLATAADEILPLKDPRVKSNPAYLSVILLSRVVTTLGELDDVTPHVVESLFVSDLAYLQDLYGRVNAYGADAVEAVCPECGEAFEAEVAEFDGEGSLDGTAGRPATNEDGVSAGNPRAAVEPPSEQPEG